MANLDDILSSAQGGQLIANLSQRFGLSEEETDSAVRALAPALGMGLHNAAEEPMALEKLFGLLAAQEQHAGYDDDAAAHSDDSLTQGRALLDDLFGSSSNTDRVVQAAARQSGVGSDILSQLLPVLASVLLGGLFKSVNNQGLGGVLGQLVNSGALNDILGQVLGGGGRGPQPGPMPPGGDGPFGGPGGGMGPGGGLGRAPGGGLGGLLGGILGSLLGGRGAPPGFPRGGGMGGGPGSGRGPLDPEPGYGGGGAAGLPEGIDQASVKDAIEQIQKTLQVGRGGSGGQTVSGAGGGQSDLESLLGQIFGKK